MDEHDESVVALGLGIADCRLCSGSLGGKASPWPGHDGYEIRCPTCGTYRITARGTGTAIPQEVRFLLSAATRRASERGRCEVIDGEPLRLLEGIVEPNPVGKMSLILDFLAVRTEAFGAQVRFAPKNDYPLVVARDHVEMINLVEELQRQGLIAFAAQGFVKLTLAGWLRAEESKRSSRSSSQAFVAMWFAEELNDAWTAGFRPALEEMGYRPVRIDNVEHNGKIDDLIISSIRESGLLVADFTGHRGGVYFEAGFALGLGLHVIWTCREGDIGGAHFDTRQYNHIVWKDPAGLRVALCNRIRASIPNYPRTD